MKSVRLEDTVRPPAVAGTFYPDHAGSLREMVDRYLRAVRPPVSAQATRPVKALIAPHAGFSYSGPIAASAFIRLESGGDRIRRVLLVGPAHRVAFDGIASSSADAYATPLGAVPVDVSARGDLAGLRIPIYDPAHESEHSLEVELPFLQLVLPQFAIVPLVVGTASGAEVEAVLNRLWGGPETLIVISSDLSHYYPYGTAQRLDQATAAAIEELRPEAIGPEQACGYVPIQGLLRSARARRMRVQRVDLRNSGDTAGTRDRVVGYGAFVFDEPTPHEP